MTRLDHAALERALSRGVRWMPGDVGMLLDSGRIRVMSRSRTMTALAMLGAGSDMLAQITRAIASAAPGALPVVGILDRRVLFGEVTR